LSDYRAKSKLRLVVKPYFIFCPFAYPDNERQQNKDECKFIMMNTNKKTSLLLCCIALLLPFKSVLGANAPLFETTEIVNITLSGPFRTIDKQRDKEQEYEGGTLRYIDNGQEVSLDVSFEVRGNFRLREDVCSYSQLWLDFKRGQVEGTLFENQNKLKLVVQCKNPSRYERLIVKENQAYQIFNTVTDHSFRSRLLNVTYQDTDNDRERTQLGIFIEHKDGLADRIGMENVDLNSINYTELAQQQANLVDLYMFMVANTDYSIISAPEDECCHNAKLFQSANDAQYYPAPYDFDSSGYVDASYAQPNPSLRLRSVRQRLYRGFCFPDNITNTSLQTFRDLEGDIMAIAGDTTYVNQKTATNSVKYLQEFYDIINDPKDLQRDILDDCRGIL
jgi:hypothetical protein